MYRKVLNVLMMCAVLANQAMAVAVHSHGEPCETTSRPHVHLNGHDHSHVHNYGHSHPHEHEHHHDDGISDEKGHEASATNTPSHDSDAFFFVEPESLHSPESHSVESTIAGNSFAVLNWVSHRVPSNTLLFGQLNMGRQIAHALILKKIRLLL